MELHGREMADEFCLKMPDFNETFRGLLHAVNVRHGTDGFTSPLKEGVLRILFALKNLIASVGFEPPNVGTKVQHSTSRPPKPQIYSYLGSVLRNTPLRRMEIKWQRSDCEAFFTFILMLSLNLYLGPLLP